MFFNLDFFFVYKSVYLRVDLKLLFQGPPQEVLLCVIQDMTSPQSHVTALS